MNREGPLPTSEAKRIIIVGAGGQARELAWIVGSLPGRPYQLVGMVVSELSFLGPHDDREVVLGDYSWLDAHRQEVDAVALGVGMPWVRALLSRDLEERYPDLDFPAIVHPRAIIGANVRLARG